MSHTDWIAVTCGLATFLLRLVPLWQARRQTSDDAGLAARQRRLAGIGLAAITALLAISLWTPLAQDPRWTCAAAEAIALLVVFVVKHSQGGIAVPTLAGALAYGVVSQWLG